MGDVASGILFITAYVAMIGLSIAFFAAAYNWILRPMLKGVVKEVLSQERQYQRRLRRRVRR